MIWISKGFISLRKYVLFIYFNLQPSSFQRGSGALPGGAVSAAPGYCGWCEGDSRARSGRSHHDVGQHLVHPAHGSQHDGGELPVRGRWPAGPGHVAGALLPEGGGGRNWMKAGPTASSYQVWVCSNGGQMLGRVSEAQNQLRSERRQRCERDGWPSFRRHSNLCTWKTWTKTFQCLSLPGRCSTAVLILCLFFYPHDADSPHIFLEDRLEWNQSVCHGKLAFHSSKWICSVIQKCLQFCVKWPSSETYIYSSDVDSRYILLRTFMHIQRTNTNHRCSSLLVFFCCFFKVHLSNHDHKLATSRTVTVIESYVWQYMSVWVSNM